MANVKFLPEVEREELYRLIEQAIHEKTLQNCRDNFLDFVRYVWPGFICGPHHIVMAEEFQKLADGTEKRVSISLPPRSGKSMLTAVYFPAWYLGKYPDKKILQASHKAELATGFGRQVRELFSDPKFREVFPDVALRADNKAAGRWGTNKGGSYYAVGVGAGIAGFGSDLCLAPESVIITNEGEMPITDVVDNPLVTHVLSIDPETNELVFKKILAKGGRFSQEMIDVVIGGETTSCTPEHPFFVRGKGFVQAKDLKSGDVVCRVRLKE